MNEPTQHDPELLVQHRRLDVARRIEHTTALLRQVQSRTEEGPHQRTRRRLRRQMKRLLAVLEEVQRDALSPAGEVSAALGEHLASLDRALRDALYASPSKPQWKALRVLVKEHRRAIDELT